jgi:hypothetical protein
VYAVGAGERRRRRRRRKVFFLLLMLNEADGDGGLSRPWPSRRRTIVILIGRSSQGLLSL